jgi:hypothetical protein
MKEIREPSEQDARNYAAKHPDICFGLTKEQIISLMNSQYLSLEDIDDIKQIHNALHQYEFVVAGSAVLAAQGLLNRKVSDIDIVITDTGALDVLEKVLPPVKSGDMSSNEFQMYTEQVTVSKFKLLSGRTLDVFLLKELPKFNTLILPNTSSTSIKFETVKSVLQSKQEYMRTGRLSDEKRRKQDNDLNYINKLTFA